MLGKQVKDRRVERTHQLLHGALFALIREKAYESIVVKEILERANVGRSTFYMHFRDKDELLVSGMQHRLRSAKAEGLGLSAKPYEQLIWFSLPLLEHINQHRDGGGVRIGLRGRAVVHEHLQRVIAEMIAQDVKRAFQSRRPDASPVSAEIFVQYVASTFILVLNWWVEIQGPLGPHEVNDIFRALVLPTLAATFE